MNSHRNDTPGRDDRTHPRRTTTNRRWILRFGLLIVLYASAAEWSIHQNVDAIAAALPGWNLIQSGTLDLSRFKDLSPWIIETGSGAFSNRPPGLIVISALVFLPTQLFTSDFTGIPTTAVAVLATGLAVIIVARVTEETVGASAGRFVWLALGLGTPTWPISSSQLLPHGLDQLWLALMLWGTTRDRPWLVGLSAAVVTLTRPPVAVIPVVVGVTIAWRTRSAKWTPTALIGGTAVGVALLLVYNAVIFGAPTLTGGYSALVESSNQYRTPLGYVSNLVGTLFDPAHSLLFWSLWLIVCLFGLSTAWRNSSSTLRAYALGGLAYLLIHTALNRYWGGMAFNYRYGIEAITVSMPVLAAAWLAALRRLPRIRTVLTATLIFAIVLQGTDALLSGCESDGSIATCRLIDV